MLKYAIKISGAALIAFIFLNIFSFFYYNPTIHMPSENGATDFIRQRNKFYMYATEGCALGTTDSNGYNNLQIYAPGSIDALVMGSSHIEAFYVPQSDNASYVFEQMMREVSKNYRVYNIGIASHTLFTCINNMSKAVQAYNPKEAIIIETQSVKFTSSAIEQFLNGDLKQNRVHDTPYMYFLQSIPYLKVAYNQIRHIYDVTPSINFSNRQEANATQLNAAMRKARQSAGNLKVIIFYHPHMVVDGDGSVKTDTDADALKIFAQSCQRNNIIFLDMSQIFLDNYAKRHILPHGFSNTQVGTGHLNSDGHRMIAGALRDLILPAGHDMQ